MKGQDQKSLKEIEEECVEFISNGLDDQQAKKLRRLSGGLFNNRKAEFDKLWAQRWVCKRAYELGWDKEIFEDFERIYTKNANRRRPSTERIGKKYQRIAYQEFLAHLSDNLYFLEGFYYNQKPHKYLGPWQVTERDIDPTIWIEKTKSPDWGTMSSSSWWCPANYSFKPKSIEEKKNGYGQPQICLNLKIY